MPKDQNNLSTNIGFLDHLEVLRWHLIRVFIALSVVLIISFNLKHFIFDYLIFGPSKETFFTYKLLCSFSDFISKNISFIKSDAFCVKKMNFFIISTKLSGQFLMHITGTLVFSFIVTFPYFIYEIWRFIKPALYEDEKKHTKGVIFYVSILFFLGVLFGYYILCPVSVQFLSNYSVGNIENQIQINSYVSSITTMVLFSGIVFQIPVLIYFLTKAGLVNNFILSKYRKHSFVIILVFSAIITPPDIASQLILSLPLWLLYEVSISISKRHSRKNDI